MTTYIDPTTELPQNLGEIYSDRNIRIVGQARINPSNSNQIDTLGIQILCTPIGGGAEGISNITNGTYTLSGAGSSLWVKITRSGTATVTPEIYAAGAQPKSRRDYVQVFYQTSSSQIVSISSFLIYSGPLYTRLGYGIGQRVYDAIVGNSGDDHVTHTDLQTAINDTPTNGWILVKKMCLVTTTITTASKSLKLVFQGTGTGLQASGSPGTGITFQAAGCQLVGLGTITGFTTYGVNLNNQTNCRIEMVFTGNTTNINYGTLVSTQYNIEGSIGVDTRQWDAVVGLNTDPTVTHTDLQTAITYVATNAPSTGGWILVKKMCLVTSTISIPSGKPIKLQFQGSGTGLQASGSPGTGIIFSNTGCQLVGYGTITGFTTYGVNLNSQTGSRIEMVFSGNTNNVNTTGLTGLQYSLSGSYGLSETSHIQTASLEGVLGRWNNTTKRWEPISGIGGKTITVETSGVMTISTTSGSTVTIDATGKLVSTGTIQGNIVIGAVYQ